jgi:RimJ/RimL family protein N-acetyltransferase
MKNLPVLETERVALRPFTREFVPLYHEWLQNEEILRMTGTERGLTIADIHEMRDEIEKSENMTHYLIFAKTGKEPGRPIGDVDLRDIKFGDCAESAIMNAEPGRGFRFCSDEAYRLLLRYGFDKFGLKMVTAPVFYFNLPSIGLHKRLGFHEAGRVGDDIIYELTKENFYARMRK